MGHELAPTFDVANEHEGRILQLLFAAPMVLLPLLTRWVNAIEYPVWILAGLMFPVTLLPVWSRGLSLVLAPYWAADSVSLAARVSRAHSA